MRVELEISTPPSVRTLGGEELRRSTLLGLAQAVADALRDQLPSGAVVHRLTVEEDDA